MDKSKNFESRLLGLEKRIRNKTDLESELSVDLLSILQKKLMNTIREINYNYNNESNQKEPENKSQIKENNNNEIIVKKEKNDQNTIIETKIFNDNNEEMKTIEIKNENKTENKIDNEIIKKEEKQIEKKKNLLENFVKVTTPKQSLKRKSDEIEIIKETKKQSCIDVYFAEKPNSINENSSNNDKFLSEAKKLKFKQVKFEIEKSPMKNIPIKEFPEAEKENKINIFADYEKFAEKDKEIQNLKNALEQKEQEIIEKERNLKRLNAEKSKYKEIHETFIDNFISYKTQVQKLLSRYLLECERYKKNEIKTHLANQRHRLGEYVSQRNGSKFEDIWMDGYELRNLKEKLQYIISDRQEKELKKKALSTRKSENLKTESFQIQLDKANLSYQIKLLKTEEENLKEKIERLNDEIFDFVTEYKNQYEEDHSKYGKPNQSSGKPSWPILNERYQLLNLIGKGGFSEVYKGFDLEDFRPVACKIHELNPMWSENTKERYITHAGREIEIHKDLDHINIVKLFDIVEININTFCTVLEFCEGPDLGYYLKRHKTIPEKEAKIILTQIITGIKYLNESKNKIIHYDLKPQNIMFHKGIIKISDFGLCKIMDENASKLELTSQGVGTYWYLPPECFQSPHENPLISPKVDIWSIGVIFYEMLFGCKPFGNQMTQEKILQEKIILKSNNVVFPNSPNVSTDAKDIIVKCLEYDQNKRIDILTLAECGYLKQKNKK